MSDSEHGNAAPESDPEDGPSRGPGQGPNLTLIYSLIALALVAAIGLAALIVLPFYRRR